MRRILPAAVLVTLWACGSSTPSSPSPPPVPTPSNPVPPPGASPAVSAMIRDLPSQIASALATNQENLPRNPNNAVYIQAKIALLQNPSLASTIVSGTFWSEGSVASTDGRTIAVVALFPDASMRDGALQSVGEVTRALPLLEEFLAASFPHAVVRIWYGFIIGNSGGGGTLNMEDAGTYLSRTGPGRLPYEAILSHEVSHSYISNESLTQFLELYAYNVLRTGSTSLAAWVFTRNHMPFLASNQDSAALLDVYALIDRDAMARAYRTVYPLRPPYGQPLSAECRQAFVDQAPESARSQVAALVARVTF